ncbi:hypothetical protein [Mycobacterium talmoniae]|uniref:Integral membrane protein n=1 Tax=Mycobacterium talmoniae TaxID=1858794 RepID=A0A1S1MVD2_9MYCO|nr:hypothetical protein [Mycobacterium talmoniae]OHU90524.1 hypothetical protein BKN37_25510 [Mycobacterium talmoniae]
MRIGRGEAIAVAVGLALVVAAFVVPHLGWGSLTPVDTDLPALRRTFGDAAPLFGQRKPHVGWGSIPAVVLGAATVRYGPDLAQRLAWRRLTWATWATACGWAFALAMIDGWRRGFTGRLTDPHEYLHQVPGITDIPATLRTFTGRILDFQPNSWVTHVSGHPPGALLTFVWLDRLGLGGGAWAGLLCLLVGSSAAAAILVALQVLGDEATARRAAPFVAVAPTAIWVAVSADGYFAGVAAWGLALLAVAVRGHPRAPLLTAAGAGLLLGWAVYLNYGLTLLALPAAAVLACATDARTALRTLAAAAVTALAVAAVFTPAGFCWFDGYTLVQQRYWQGVANIRPFGYWVWGNLAAVVCAIGLGSVAGLGRVLDVAAIRRRSGPHLLLLAALIAIVCADLSMLSKAETERIWLPFTVWLTAAPALLPRRSHRLWLALNVLGALLINHLILTNW